MAGTIALALSQTGEAPFHSVGYVNNAFAPMLRRSGWRVRSFEPPRVGIAQEGMLPFGLARSLVALEGGSRPDVALYDAAAVSVRVPSRESANRNMVLYHGLAYSAGTWMTSPEIDLHCANSPYLASTLHALFAQPNWLRRRCLNPRGMLALTHIRLPVPCVEAPDGHPGFAHGTELPRELQQQLEGNVVWGHALQPGKQDWLATLSILYWLNEIGARPFKLLVSEHSLTDDTRRALDGILAPHRRSCADFFLRVPHLEQRSLFRVMRACRFALAYNLFPEPFGFYVLESVHNGCPVYTNGSGNNRFLLPPGQGIQVIETAEMANDPGGQRDIAAYRCVAERIVADLSRASEIQDQCRKGAAHIARTWSISNFERDVLVTLDQVGRPRAAEVDFESLRVKLSPLMRSFDPASGRFLNDYASGTLPGNAAALLSGLVGQHCSALGSRDMQRLEDEHGFFARGLLTLTEVDPCLDDRGSS